MTTLPGKGVITAFATLALIGGFLELGVLVTLVTFLFLMLAVPIYVGWRRSRELAVAALVAVLIAAPITGAIYSAELRTPVPTVDSMTTNGGSVLTNAHVSPFAAATGSTFTFSVTINPQYLPAGAHGPEYLVVYLSTCPGATAGNLSVCGGGGYPFWELNHTFAAPVNATTDVSLSRTLNLASFWWWLMAFVYNGSDNQTQWIWVGVSDTGSGIQGPISGDFTSTLLLILPTIYEAFTIYFLLVYLAVLVIYMFLKNRESRRNPPNWTPTLPGAPPPGGGTTAGRPAIERSCPACGAVVYPEERACWKCGAPLGGGALPSDAKAPPAGGAASPPP